MDSSFRIDLPNGAEVAEERRRFFQDRFAECEQKLQKGASAFDERVAEMDSQFQDRFAECEQKLQKSAGAFDERIAEVDRQFQERLAECEQTLQESAVVFENVSRAKHAEIDAGYQKLEIRLGRLNSQIDDDARNIRERIENGRAELTAEGERKIELLSVTLYDKIGAVDKSLEERIAALDTKIDRQFNELEEGAQGKIIAIDAKIDEFTVAIEERVEKGAALGDAISQLEESLRNSLNRTKEQCVEQFRDFESRHIADYQKAREHGKKIIEEIQTNLDNSRRHIDEMRQSLEQSITQRKQSIESMLQQRIDTIVASIDTQMDQWQKDSKRHIKEQAQSIEDHYEQSMKTYNESYHTLHRELFSKIEKRSESVSKMMNEIEKRQRSFADHIHSFEKAEKFKDKLHSDLESIRNYLQEVNEDISEVSRLSKAVKKIRKEVDDSNERLRQLQSERGRMDMLEKNYGRVIALSDTVENRLTEISSYNDELQIIQAKLRSIKEMEQSTSESLIRLEQQREVAQTTTKIVEQNFRTIGDIEKRAGELERQLSDVPERVQRIVEQVSDIAETGEAARIAAEKSRDVTEIVDQLENRISKLDMDREWLGRVETRLQDAYAAIDERLSLLQVVLDETEGLKNRLPQETRKLAKSMALRKFSISQIADHLKISKSEVEVILGNSNLER